MNLFKASKRDRELSRKKHGHVVDNRNIFVLEEIQRKKAEKIKRKQERQAHKEEIGEELHDD
jgi:hypothetical protein